MRALICFVLRVEYGINLRQVEAQKRDEITAQL